MRKTLASILLILSIVFLYKGITEVKYNISNKVNNESLREVATSKVMDNPLDRVIDFGKLKCINKNIKAWIYIPDTKVDYPILVGNSDEEYLYKDINDEYNPLGALFGFVGTDFTKGNTFIFGHNMADSQMFGSLRKYTLSSFLKEHRYIYIYTERKVMKCDIFSIFICDMNDSIFSGEYELGTVEYLELLSKMVSKNNYSDYNLNKPIINYSKNQVFNLVTCYGSEGTTDRLVISGIVIEERII